MEENKNPGEEILLVYDGECPICWRYRDYISLRQRVRLEFCDAREAPELVEDLQRRGYDLNQGMALLWGDRVLLGRDALLALDGLTLSSGWWDSTWRWVLRFPGVARVVYPLGKTIRWCALRIMGKSVDLHGSV